MLYKHNIGDNITTLLGNTIVDGTIKDRYPCNKYLYSSIPRYKVDVAGKIVDRVEPLINKR